MSYHLTPAGQELEPIVEALGRWGLRWVPVLGDEDLDPHLLLWDIHRKHRPGGRAGRSHGAAVPLHGEPWARRALPRWLKLSSLALTPRPVPAAPGRDRV